MTSHPKLLQSPARALLGALAGIGAIANLAQAGPLPGTNCQELSPGGILQCTGTRGEMIDFPDGPSSFADEVLSYDPVFQGGPAPGNPSFDDPLAGIGAPDFPIAGSFDDDGAVSLGAGGLIELLFSDNLLTNSGNDLADLHVFEVGPAVESTWVAIRPADAATSGVIGAACVDALEPHGDGFCEVGMVDGSTGSLDIDVAFQGFLPGELRFDAVQLVDSERRTSPDSMTPGADIDAVGAIRSVPVAELDPMLCYSMKTPKPAPFSMTLADELRAREFRSKKTLRICSPASKDGVEVHDPATHLQSYKIRLSKGEPKPARRDRIKVVNELGAIFLKTRKPVSLLVPAAADLESPPPVPEEGSHRVDHFECYKVRARKNVCEDDPGVRCRTDSQCTAAGVGGPCNRGLPKGLTAVVADLFQQSKRFDIKKPRLLCIPASYNGGETIEPAARLLCYKAKLGRGEPKHVKVPSLFVNNQIGPTVGSTRKEREICIPSLEIPRSPDES